MRNYYCRTLIFSDRFDMIFRRAVFDRLFLCGNNVGEQRNFCKQKCDVPFLVCLSNSTLSAQRSAYFFKTLFGTTFPHMARLHKFMNNQTLPLRAGCRISVSLRTEISPSPYIWIFSDTRLLNQRANAVRPYRLCPWFVVPQNRFALCGFYF